MKNTSEDFSVPVSDLSVASDWRPHHFQPDRMQCLILLAYGILFSALVFLSLACGRQRARVEAPRTPPSGEAQTEISEAGPETGGAKRTSAPATEAGVSEPSPDEEPHMGPNIRIGLTFSGTEAVISAPGGFNFLENREGARTEQASGKVRLQVEKGTTAETSGTCYRIQVASLRSRDAAEALRDRLQQSFKASVVLSENSDATSNRIRIGEFTSRDEAQQLLDTLKSSGYPDSFIIGDVRFATDGGAGLALRGPEGLFKLSSSGFIFQPQSDGGTLSLNGKSYRGRLEVRPGSGNQITVINELRLEEYLRGVVPAEISPTQFPEREALAAQAVAARTYALKHLGQYRSRGFDLTDDTSTQVYGGASMEKEATDDAIRETAGIAIYYNGQPIDAMYMSTCGGRTEDFSEVYDTAPVPYLTSVVCGVESDEDGLATVVGGRHRLETPLYADDGSMANRDLELALSLGLPEEKVPLSAETLEGLITRDEVIALLRNSTKILQKPAGSVSSLASSGNLDTRIGFLQSAAAFLFGADEIRRSISEMDADYYLDNLEDGDTVPEAARPVLAFLMQKSLWQPFPDNTVRANEGISRKECIIQILRWIEFIKPDILSQGTFAGDSDSQNGDSTASSLSIKWGSKVKNFPLSDSVSLFRRESGVEIPVKSVKMIGHEKTYFHLGEDGAIEFLEVELSPTGAASDRYSSQSTWETTMTRSEIAGKIITLAGNIGEFRDLEPARIGKSGRVVRIRILGSRSSVEVNGYRFRGALGLRDTLYTINRKKDPEGRIATFTFHGRGYGHGIGLCQVGAYGMAKAGKSYEEILKTYYRGVELRKAY